MIKILVMDVDGTLTDGGIYISDRGEEFKRFNSKDGYGIHNILKENGIVPVIITGRKSLIVQNRCKELKISEVYQGCNDKLSVLCEVINKYGCSMDEVACIGDDLNDIEIIKMAGLSGCPADAVQRVKNEVDYISAYGGGHGAVRDFIEWIVERGNC